MKQPRTTQQHHKLLRFYSVVAVIALCFVVFSSPSTAVRAQTVPDSCDVDFMTQMTSRAVAEASRDVMMSQTVIRKPDSVLEYTCFDQILGMTGSQAGPMFTETSRWRNARIDISSYDRVHSPGAVNITINASQPPDALDNALRNIVGSVMDTYIDNNFGHQFLGGNAGSISNPAGSGYNCTIMQQVWQAAKCENFNTDDLFTLINSPEDRRTQPKACNAPFDAPTYDYDADILNTKLEVFHRDAPGPPPPTCASVASVQTGRQVEIVSFSRGLLGTTNRSSVIRTERICTMPGCSYDYNAGRCSE